MDWSQRIAPLDPVSFRDACLALWDWCESKHEELGDEFSLMLAVPSFFMDYFDVKAGGEDAYRLYEQTTMRVFAFSKLCEQHDVDFSEVLKPRSQDHALDIHLGLIEAMAVVPFHGDGVDAEDLLAEARARVGEIDVLEKLFS